MTFEDCVRKCLANKPLVTEFDRLNKSNLSCKGAPIALEIDKCTGRLESDVKAFIAFVWDAVWTRIPREDE